MLFKTLSAAVYGIDANIIEVEVDWRDRRPRPHGRGNASEDFACDLIAAVKRKSSAWMNERNFSHGSRATVRSA